MGISVKIGVRCDSHKHVGEKSEAVLDADLSADGLVKPPSDQAGWTIRETRYHEGTEALCPACSKREADEIAAWVRR